MGKASQREAAVVEAPVDGVAVADPATRRALSGLRMPLIGLPLAGVVLGVPSVWLAMVGAGWIGVVVLGVCAAAFLFTAVLALQVTGLWIGPAGRLLRAQPWRVASVKVFRPRRGVLPKARLLVRAEGEEPVHLLAPLLPWAAQQVLARTGKIWLVGPDAQGWVAIRSAGLVLPLGQARVSPAGFTDEVEIDVAQTAPVRIPLASGDAVLSRVISAPRKRSRTDLVTPILLLVFAGIVLVDLLNRGIKADQVGLAVGVFAGTLAIVGLLAWRVRRLRFWLQVDRHLADGPWTSVPVELPDLTEARRETVAGRATLPGGREVSVTLPRAGHALRANITETGTLWTAGTPAAGKRAVVGIPGYPFVALANFGE
ncbi:hypothetical protein V5P93_000102 [Actinokineospora auranticolor]|uniref:Uncharacterized protein n=1 Tax=Actinokineospora auranticolor TaxID=155976 RepID=A0A2S6GBY1_9PSEU|nr:hypothetical protein [Actinokineospora auranticolor]PPK61736.1 hypothetical protein CLV40_13933 [Actinokineospora auranticolor]